MNLGLYRAAARLVQKDMLDFRSLHHPFGVVLISCTEKINECDLKAIGKQGQVAFFFKQPLQLGLYGPWKEDSPS